MSGLTGTTTWTHLIAGFISLGRGRKWGESAAGLYGRFGWCDPSGRDGFGGNTTFRQIGNCVGIRLRKHLHLDSHEWTALVARAVHISKTNCGIFCVTNVKEAVHQSNTEGRAACPLTASCLADFRSSFASSTQRPLHLSGTIALVGAVRASFSSVQEDFVAQGGPSHAA